MFKYLFYKKFPRIFDKNLTPEVQKKIRRWVVQFALASFVVHLALVFLGTNFESLKVITKLVPPSYLAAVYTPFSFILMYEIFELVIILPKSLTSFISKQYELISLIFIREVFKDFSHLHGLNITPENQQVFEHILGDIATGMALFLMVIIFNHVNHYRERYYSSIELKNFICIKKSFALWLGIGLIGLAIFSFYSWVLVGYQMLTSGHTYYQPIKLVFYKDFFTVMVFVDIFLMILSLIYTKSYDVIFRNAAFGVSTVLIRLSLTSPRPLSQYIAIAALGVGIVTIAIFIYYNKIMTMEERIERQL
jgi:hypothetical protein